ncbi:hypothetical protein D6C78_07612 [Aureobasidium pullulans]|uniref:Uncharacterized protein n=1 Tax=Aureobasidium pullulans TaxID=5580 RepID=A0A4T0BG60_AURPU|nr:hypothetical protein D6C78_07612 [Aureobasidium pullulans]
MSSTLSASNQTATTASELESGSWKPSEDAYGIKSYSPNGKMASVYDADSTSTFRCDNISYPPDGYYVAFWTPYDNSLASEGRSQPAPVNCGRDINFTNPLTGVSAVAVVLDRCASCVGVGNQLNDPTTDQSLVNGATVDLSRGLWNKIYDNAAGSVYDILYEGKPLQGVP